MKLDLVWKWIGGLLPKDCRILAVHSGDRKKSEAEWNKYFDWFCEMSIKLLELFENMMYKQYSG